MTSASMPRVAVCCAAAVTLCCATAASAQTSVQLYGRLDSSLDLQHNGVGSRTAASSNSSRWGLRGSEDLGGGLHAVFNLEAAFSVDVPISDGLFSRRSVVGLKGGLGELLVGREYTPLYNLLVRHFDPFGNAGAGASGDLLPYRSRESNSVTWHSPRLAGLSGSVMYTADEKLGGPPIDGAEAASIEWNGSGIGIGAAFQNRTVSAAADRRDWLLAASWKIGDWTLGAQFSEYEQSNGSFDQQSWGVSARGRMGPGDLLVSFIDLDNRAVSEGGARKYSLGYYYAMSKRTSLYTVLAYIDNDANAKFAVGPDKADMPVAGEASRSLQLGIRHNF